MQRVLINKAIEAFKERERVVIPNDILPWKKLIALGIAGGIVPCPDAIAILIISVSIGKILLGLMVVFSFSLGLSLSLILTGSLIVLSGKVAAKTNGFKRISGYLPYITSVFITGTGILMIARSLK